MGWVSGVAFSEYCVLWLAEVAVEAWLFTLQEASDCNELRHDLKSAAMQLAHLITMSSAES